MKRYAFLLLLLIQQYAFCQVFENKCVTPDVAEMKSVLVSDLIDFDKEPIKTIRIRLVFLRDDNGNGGFQENNPDHQQYISDVINNLNYYYSNILTSYDAACYDGSLGTYSDSKIRFDVDTMYLNNSLAWDNKDYSSSDFCKCPGYSCYNPNLNSLNQQIASNSIEPRINLFYTENSDVVTNIVVYGACPLPGNNGIESVSCAGFPETNIQLDQQVNMRNKFVKYHWMMNCVVDNACNNPEWVNDPPSESDAYSWLSPGMGEAHELGHSLCLFHVYPNSCVCSKHLMMNQACGWGNFLSPIEIEEIHHATCQTSLRKYVLKNTYSIESYLIDESKVWTNDLRIYRGISVTNNATFEIKNNLIIPSQASIQVSSGTLVIEDCNLSTADRLPISEISVSANFTVINSEIGNCSSLVASQGAEVGFDGSEFTLEQNGLFNVSDGSEILFESNSVMNLLSNSHVVIDNSTFTIGSGSTLEIEDGAEFIVTNNSRLEVESGATIIIKGSGRLRVKCDGLLCVNPGATLNLQDFTSGIFYNQGALASGCLSDLSSAITGPGFAGINSNGITVDNMSISTDKYYAGYDIASSNTTIQGTGTEVVFDAINEVLINSSFEVGLGATFETRTTSAGCGTE